MSPPSPQQAAYYQRLLVILAHEFDKFINIYAFKHGAFTGRITSTTHPKTTLDMLFHSPLIAGLDKDLIGVVYGAVMQLERRHEQPGEAAEVASGFVLRMLDVFRDDARKAAGHETPPDVWVPLEDPATGEWTLAVVLKADRTMVDVVGEEVFEYSPTFEILQLGQG